MKRMFLLSSKSSQPCLPEVPFRPGYGRSRWERTVEDSVHCTEYHLEMFMTNAIRGSGQRQNSVLPSSPVFALLHKQRLKTELSCLCISTHPAD